MEGKDLRNQWLDF